MASSFMPRSLVCLAGSAASPRPTHRVSSAGVRAESRAGSGIPSGTVSDLLISQAGEFLRTAGVNTSDPRLSLALSVGTQAARKVEQGLQVAIGEVTRYTTGARREDTPASWEDALMTVPDLESIPYTVVERYENVEIRRVESYLVAETRMSTSGRGFDFLGSGQAFNVLAGYLFGKNKSRKEMEMTTPMVSRRSSSSSGSGGRGEAMEMTTPVISSRRRRGSQGTASGAGSGVEMEMTTPVINSRGPGDEWRMSFVIPSKFNEDTIPLPEDDSVAIRRVPPRLVAVTAFPGYVADDDVARRERALRAAVAQLSRYAVAPGAEAEVFQYNPPFTPPFLRRNEVALEIIAVD